MATVARTTKSTNTKPAAKPALPRSQAERNKLAKARKAAAPKPDTVLFNQIEKVQARNAAKKAAKPAPATAAREDDAERIELKAAGKPLPASLTGLPHPATLLGAEAPAKAAKPAKQPATEATGVKAEILKLMQRKNGVSEREVCEKLNWAKAGATISRAIKLAPFKVAKERGDDGKMRYIAVEG